MTDAHANNGRVVLFLMDISNINWVDERDEDKEAEEDVMGKK